MLQATRKENIISLLKSNKEFKIGGLCKHFEVSLATMHRDLNELEREGRVKKTHGGVLLNVIEDIETRNIIRLRTNVDLKKRIAKKALDFVKNEDCIFLDNSTTCYYFAKELAESKFQNLVIVTNSYLIPGIFINNKNIQVVLTGGAFLRDLNCFVGHAAIRAVSDFNGRLFFLSIAAISLKDGLSDIYRPESDEIKRHMLKRSKENICLVDSTKFNKSAQSIVLKISDVDNIITDHMCSESIKEDFLKDGIKLIIA